jgi:hypothetical protein
VYREQVREDMTPKKMPSGVAVISVKAPVEKKCVRHKRWIRGGPLLQAVEGAVTDKKTCDNAGARAACEGQGE